jgi:hypothetical protein
MKHRGTIVLCTAVLLAALVVVGVAYAHQPPAPTCPQGQITVTPAAWVPEVPAVYHTEHRTWWHNWQDGDCSGHWFCETRQALTTLAVPGYWIDPVCRAPVVTHDVDCEGVRELVEGVFVQYIYHWTLAYQIEAWQGYNEPAECLVVHCQQTVPTTSLTTWGAWVSNGDGTYTRTGTYTVTDYDALDLDYVCGFVTVPVSETLEGTFDVQTFADCDVWAADMFFYGPYGEAMGSEHRDGAWQDPYELESIGQFGETIYEPQECHQDFPGCMDPSALNYDPLAEVPGGECNYTMCPWNPDIRATDADCHAPYCDYTVTTYWRCNTGAPIWSQETGIQSGEGSNFIGYAPYNRVCAWCDDINPSIYHREWRNDCDGSGWDEGTWNLPEWLHTLGGCPLGGRCTG